METISIKLEKGIAEQIRRAQAEFNYSTKTEFIRDAIRQKLNGLEEERRKEKAWRALFALRGAFKGKGKAKTDEEFRKIREQAFEELLKERGIKFSQK